MLPRFIVYALVDPRDSAVRYIGKSSTGLDRARSHFEPGRVATDSNLHKARWIQGLIALGVRPDIRILDEAADDPALLTAEVKWIAHGRAEGWPLTNLTNGGDGAAGYRPSAETRAKMSAAQRARPPRSEETRAKIAASKRGKARPDLIERNLRSPDQITALGRANKGRKRPDLIEKNRSPEMRAKVSASKMGRKRRSPATTDYP